MECHCEERSDEAISMILGRLLRPDFIGTRNDNAESFSALALILTNQSLNKKELKELSVNNSKQVLPQLV